MKVFYIDDEKGNTILFSGWMPPTYEVMTFTDPLEAEAAFLNIRPEVIVSDEDMPQMRGIKLLERAEKVLPQSLRIIVTGKVDIRALESETTPGSVHFFVGKPYDPNFIISRIQAHFGESGAANKAAPTEKRVVEDDYSRRTFEAARAVYLEREKLKAEMRKIDQDLQDKTADLFMQLGSAISYKQFKTLLSLAHEDGQSYQDFQEIYWRFNSIKKGS